MSERNSAASSVVKDSLTTAISSERPGVPSRHRRYPAYKDSGIEWLGEIPAGWEAQRLKYRASMNNEALPETTDPDYEFSYVDIGNVDAVSGITAREELRFEDAPSRARRLVRDGDTIVSTVRTYLRAIAPIRAEDGTLVVSTGFAVVRPQNVAPGFLSYALRSPFFVETVVSRSTGVSYPAINPSEIGNIPVTLPPLPEQRAIASFLDRETDRIDRLIAKKERQIELLAERRSAVISHAVTKGLDPDAPMKDSGVEWLGEIPAGWEVKQLRRAVTFQRGHDLPEDHREEGDVPVVSSGGISGEHAIAVARSPGIVTGRYGTIGQFHLIERDYWPLNTTLYSIDLHENSVHYLTYMLNHLAPLFLLNSAKSAVPGVDRNDIHPVETCLPPLPEQRAIADYLDRETQKIDALSAKVGESIERLREYRTALISAAVTGKIDVRGSAADAA